MTAYQTPDLAGCSQDLQTAVTAWMINHPDDVVFTVTDSQDVLILGSNAEYVAWIDYEGSVKKSAVRWDRLI